MSSHYSHITQINKNYDSQVNPHQSHLARNYKRTDSDMQKLFAQIKKVKYPVLAVEPAEQLENKISLFKNEKLQTQMKLKLLHDKRLNAYRKIRGDGNCFIRALAYSYLSNVKDLSDVNAVFYQLEDIDLTICIPKSIPKEFKPFYNDKLLKEILISNWGIDVKYFKNVCRQNNKRILSRMFRKSPYLDFIVILYFRSLCLKGLQKHKEQVKDFMKGTQQEQIKTYGQQSQGVILDICSRFLKVSIDVYELRKQQLNHYSYRNQKHLKELFSVSLLYYENHYDIIETIDPRLLDEERNDTKIIQEEYYSKIDQHMIEGQCIQCEKEDYIYEENNLCDRCFQISKNQMLNNVKQDKWVRGLCRDCGRSGLKVLELLSLCQACAKLQSQVSEQDMKKSPKKSYRCEKCSLQLDDKNQCPKCSTIEIGMCLQCGIKNYYIDKQTKLCRQCANIQSKQYERTLRKQQYLKNQCPKCNQQLNSTYHELHCMGRPVQLCMYCNASNQSEIHQMKCVKKLTAGKIGFSKVRNSSIADEVKQQEENRRCRECYLKRDNQTLVSGWCKNCREYLDALDRKKNDSYFKSGSIISQSSHKVQQPKRLIGGESCKSCNRCYYLHKLKNGYCDSCSSRLVRGYKL